jgi:hypothetical protein
MNALMADLQERWKPSEEQIALARKTLEETGAAYVYTVHVLIGKEYGVWTDDIAVHPIEGQVFHGDDWEARGAAMEAAVAHAQSVYTLTKVKTTGGYTVHRLIDGEDHWAVFEDILAVFPKER